MAGALEGDTFIGPEAEVVYGDFFSLSDEIHFYWVIYDLIMTRQLNSRKHALFFCGFLGVGVLFHSVFSFLDL